MFDVPVDTLYVWVGVAVVATVVAGVAVSLPGGTAPRAAATARAVEAVSTGPPGAHGTHRLAAERIRLGSSRVTLDGSAGTGHASFAYGPVVPAWGGDLATVLAGTPPDRAFATVAAFRKAVADARAHRPTWRRAPDRLEIRRVQWGDVDATLVG